MTTRRKTWMGVGVFAIAGTTASTIGAAAPTVGDMPTATITQPSIVSQAVDDIGIRPIVVATGEGGEGGVADGLPPSYELLSTDPEAFTYDAGDEIAAYAAGVHASYAAAAAVVGDVQDAVNALLADPSEETLAAARAAWVAARPSYLVTEAFRFYDGPIEAIEGEINAWPLNEAFIDYVEGRADAGIINRPDELLSIAALLVNNQMTDESDVTLGWHAIEFLLWGQDLNADGPGNRPASDYIAGEGNNDRRREYLAIATSRLVANIGRLAQAWAPDVPDNYAAIFQVLPKREAIGRIMNGVAILAGFEFMSERLAVGLDSGDQEDEHSCFSDTTHQDFVYDLKGIANVWTGDYPALDVPGMRDLVAKVDADLSAEVDDLLAKATTAVALLGDPWDRVLASPPDSPERATAEEAVTALQQLADGLRRAGNELGVLVQIPAG